MPYCYYHVTSQDAILKPMSIKSCGENPNSCFLFVCFKLTLILTREYFFFQRFDMVFLFCVLHAGELKKIKSCGHWMVGPMELKDEINRAATKLQIKVMSRLLLRHYLTLAYIK